jgi:hypothetical protein
MKFTRIVFCIAAIYGFIFLIPMYFLMNTIGQKTPPAISHPEFYYGFVGVTLLWQCVFVLIALDSWRFQAVIPIAVLEKVVYTVPVVILYLMDKEQLTILGTALVDPIFAILFISAYLRMNLLRVPRSAIGSEEARTS